MLILVRYLHVVAMAAWLGSALWLAGDARRSLAAGPDAARAFMPRALVALRLDRWAGLATILTGLGLIHLTHVWPALPPALVAGMALGLVRLGVTDGLLRPAVRRLAARLDAGEPAEALLPAARRLSMLSGIGHLAWLGALAGMIAAT
jgi:hypothetical protein